MKATKGLLGDGLGPVRRLQISWAQSKSGRSFAHQGGGSREIAGGCGCFDESRRNRDRRNLMNLFGDGSEPKIVYSVYYAFSLLVLISCRFITFKPGTCYPQLVILEI